MMPLKFTEAGQHVLVLAECQWLHDDAVEIGVAIPLNGVHNHLTRVTRQADDEAGKLSDLTTPDIVIETRDIVARLLTAPRFANHIGRLLPQRFQTVERAVQSRLLQQ